MFLIDDLRSTGRLPVSDFTDRIEKIIISASQKCTGPLCMYAIGSSFSPKEIEYLSDVSIVAVQVEEKLSTLAVMAQILEIRRRTKTESVIVAGRINPTLEDIATGFPFVVANAYHHWKLEIVEHADRSPKSRRGQGVEMMLHSGFYRMSPSELSMVKFTPVDPSREVLRLAVSVKWNIGTEASPTSLSRLSFFFSKSKKTCADQRVVVIQNITVSHALLSG